MTDLRKLAQQIERKAIAIERIVEQVESDYGYTSDELSCTPDDLMKWARVVRKAWEGGEQVESGDACGDSPAAPDPFGLYHDSIHKDSGRSRPAKTCRTSDGRPVSGFREQDDAFWKAQYDMAMGWFADARERIAELEREVEDYRVRLLDEEGRTADAERERDEARAERDTLLNNMPKSTAKRIAAQGWARFDDDGIERILQRYFGVLKNDDRVDLEVVLRDFREGKF